MSAQIERFRQGHRVIAMDSRDQGRSGDFRAPFVKKDRIKDFMSSFEKMRAAQQPR